MSEDFIQGTQGFGNVASRLMTNSGKPSALRTNDILQYDEWKEIDETVVRVTQERMNGVADLRGAGLTYNVGNGLGKMSIQWQTMSDTIEADVNMAGVTEAQNDRPEFATNSMPLPIISRDFYYNIRELSASRAMGDPLDTTTVEQATRNVIEKNEQMLFNGLGSIGDGSIYGYTTHPDRSQVSFYNDAWDASATSGTDILQDVLNMKQDLIDNGYYGPYTLYVPTNYSIVLDDDLKAESDKTVRQRLEEIEGVSMVKVADFLSDDNVVMVQMSRDVVDLVVGMEPTTVQWEVYGGMQSAFKVMDIIVPRIKSTYNNKSGIAHLS